MREIYLDNAATSWPKPEEVYRALESYMRTCGGTPARGRHRKALAADRVLADCRNRLEALFHARGTHHVALTSGATESTNLALKGLVPAGAHVVLTDLEHNSVVRPLMTLKRDRSVELTVVPSQPDGSIDPKSIQQALRPHTKLVTCTHSSNVLGTLVDIAPIAEVTHRHGALFLVDAAQTSGIVDIDVNRLGIDLLAFTGHKSLLGPPATGGLVFRKDLDLCPLKEGGTGTFSENPEQPREFPDRYESGSPNMYGIAGLAAGLAYLETRGLSSIHQHKTRLVARLQDGIASLPAVRHYGTTDPSRSAGIVALNVGATSSEQLANLLWEQGGIMVRAGLHCAPFLHRRLGTSEQGVTRVGIGFSTTPEDINILLRTLQSIS